jgi:hypothetical protein
MGQSEVRSHVKGVGLTAYRLAVLAAVTLIVVGMFLGMAFLVYRGEMTEGPLILYGGVILGYLLRVVREVV